MLFPVTAVPLGAHGLLPLAPALQLYSGKGVLGPKNNKVYDNKLSESKRFVRNKALREREGVFLFLLFLCQEASFPAGFILECID